MKATDEQPAITDDIVKMHSDYLVPAIYAQFAHHTVELAEIDIGQSVLDVACRTGSLSRTVLLEVGPTGKVIGLDHNAKMLTTARRLEPAIEWQPGDAALLPYEDDSFDRVMCQFALMFLKNRVATIKEMLRVCKPDGMVVIAIWAPLDHSKAYGKLLDLTNKFAGPRIALKLSKPWSLGSHGQMDSLLLSCKVKEYECHERPGVATFPSIESFVETRLRATGDFHSISEDNFADLLAAAKFDLRPFITSDGKVAAALDAHIFLVNPQLFH